LITYDIMKTSFKNSAKNFNTSDIILSSKISHIPIACENNLLTYEQTAKILAKFYGTDYIIAG